MKFKSFFGAMILAVILFSTSVSFAQQGDQAEMMKKWQEYMTPGSVHQQFAKMAGNWKATVTQFMGGQESKSEGTATYSMVLGGRYLHGSFNAIMIGMPFEGMSLDAYDNGTKEYISLWLDNMGTGVMMTKGKMDDKTKTVTYWGSMYDPMTGKDQKVKTVMKEKDDNNCTFEMYTVDNGKETKNMQIDYTRVK
jgi:hypothetical protein